MKHYVVGFAFDLEKRRVVLIEKKRPAWQKGRFNGVGGKIEKGEAPFDAMVREFKEEAGIEVYYQWRPLIKLHTIKWEVFFFYSFTDISNCRTMTDELITIIPTKRIPSMSTIISSLKWLVPMCLDPEISTYENVNYREFYISL